MQEPTKQNEKGNARHMISTQLSTHWESLRTSFWFIPTIMVCVAMGLAKLLLIFDHYGYQAPAKFLQYFYDPP
jgi:uncharacterized membrane protein